MATKYLGPEFDIHAGGLDLVFPHHENEQAQSRAVGDGFARYWVHNAMLNLSGAKMSKSLGNVLGVAEMAQQWRPVELRYYLGSAHYRSVMEFSEDALAEAAAAYRRIESFVERAEEAVGEMPAVEPGPPAEFAAALDDDLGVPRALAHLHTVIRDGNNALADGDIDTVRGSLAAVLSMTGILGLDPRDWNTSRGGDLRPTIDVLVQVALDQRAAARTRKDFAAADSIRDELAHAGVLVEDTAAGPRWSLKSER